ncbi:hypothetical protein PYW07_012933 [Mythimna separata]|uniref:Reverse transcriptase n=1 Tax=Mythimna separata TaxID=271217 RepID=A0AAD7Y932_MYTSE|nr:hypothetical protein PYW07_012933 [Mythimna separata]
MEALGSRLRGLFSACMERGQFPLRWKIGKLVLIAQPGRPADSPSAYRPIVLLDEVGKLFKRVIVDRLVGHLARVGLDLADGQFGFRRRHFTVDAIKRVRVLTAGDAVIRGRIVLGVSLDIANAFNWSSIEAALRYHEVPAYLRRVIEAYLSDRFIIYPGHQGEWRPPSPLSLVVRCSVGIGNRTTPVERIRLRAARRPPRRGQRGLLRRRHAGPGAGKSYQAAAETATRGVARVEHRIQQLGLKVTLHKSEAMCFHGPLSGVIGKRSRRPLVPYDAGSHWTR